MAPYGSYTATGDILSFKAFQHPMAICAQGSATNIMWFTILVAKGAADSGVPLYHWDDIAWFSVVVEVLLVLLPLNLYIRNK